MDNMKQVLKASLSELQKTEPPKDKTCGQCRFLSKKQGSMPLNRLCNRVPAEDIFVLECSPNAKACIDFEQRR